MPACYTDRLSLYPGERFALHVSAKGPARVEVARIGAGREVALALTDIDVAEHPVPANADRDGCAWPAAAQIEVGADWRSGYYDILLTDADGEETHHFICVKAAPDAKARMVLVLSTNTWHAYNYFGGANAYCDVAALMSRKAPLPEAMLGAIGRLSSLRPFPQLQFAPPADAPRLVNLRKRGFEERPWAGADPAWSAGLSTHKATSSPTASKFRRTTTIRPAPSARRSSGWSIDSPGRRSQPARTSSPRRRSVR